MSKPVLTPVPPPHLQLATDIESRVKNPLFEDVKVCVYAHDLGVENGTIQGKNPLLWIFKAFATPETELTKNAKMIKDAIRCFDKTLMNLQDEIREAPVAKRFAVEALAWAEAGWQFRREMRGISVLTLKDKDIGFNDEQITLTKFKGEEIGELSLLDIAKKVVEKESVLTNREFRQASLSAFSSFFLHAYGELGSEISELLDYSDEIAICLYGKRARLADREPKRQARKRR